MSSESNVLETRSIGTETDFSDDEEEESGEERVVECSKPATVSQQLIPPFTWLLAEIQQSAELTRKVSTPVDLEFLSDESESVGPSKYIPTSNSVYTETDFLVTKTVGVSAVAEIKTVGTEMHAFPVSETRTIAVNTDGEMQLTPFFTSVAVRTEMKTARADATETDEPPPKETRSVGTQTVEPEPVLAPVIDISANMNTGLTTEQSPDKQPLYTESCSHTGQDIPVIRLDVLLSKHGNVPMKIAATETDAPEQRTVYAETDTPELKCMAVETDGPEPMPLLEMKSVATLTDRQPASTVATSTNATNMKNVSICTEAPAVFGSTTEPVQEPVTVPVQEPVTALMRESVTAPEQESVTAPVQVPVIAPKREPVTALVREPEQEPMQESLTAQVQGPVTAPLLEPVQEPMKEPVAAPVWEPVTAPVREPVQEPMKEPVIAPVREPVQEPVTAQVREPVTAAVRKPMQESVTAQVRKPQTAPVREPVQESMKEPVIAPVRESVTAPVWEPVIAPMQELVAAQCNKDVRNDNVDANKKSEECGEETPYITIIQQVDVSPAASSPSGITSFRRSPVDAMTSPSAKSVPFTSACIRRTPRDFKSPSTKSVCFNTGHIIDIRRNNPIEWNNFNRGPTTTCDMTMQTEPEKAETAAQTSEEKHQPKAKKKKKKKRRRPSEESSGCCGCFRRPRRVHSDSSFDSLSDSSSEVSFREKPRMKSRNKNYSNEYEEANENMNSENSTTGGDDNTKSADKTTVDSGTNTGSTGNACPCVENAGDDTDSAETSDIATDANTKVANGSLDNADGDRNTADENTKNADGNMEATYPYSKTTCTATKGVHVDISLEIGVAAGEMVDTKEERECTKHAEDNTKLADESMTTTCSNTKTATSFPKPTSSNIKLALTDKKTARKRSKRACASKSGANLEKGSRDDGGMSAKKRDSSNNRDDEPAHAANEQHSAMGDKDDLIHVFLLEPFAVRFSSPTTAMTDFAVLAIHTDPTDAKKEVCAIQRLYNVTRAMWFIEDILIAGDFTMTESYDEVTDWLAVEHRSDTRLARLVEEETSDYPVVCGRDCSYDRLILAGSQLVRSLVPGSTGIFRFDHELKLSPDKVQEISGHYPLHFKIAGAAITKWQKHITTRAGVVIEQSKPIPCISNVRRMYHVSPRTHASAYFHVIVLQDEHSLKEVRATRHDVTDVVQCLREFQRAFPGVLWDGTVAMAGAFVSSHWMTSPPAIRALTGVLSSSAVDFRFTVAVTASLREPLLCHVSITHHLLPVSRAMAVAFD